MTTLGLHLALLDDRVRTRAYDRALAEAVRPGDVVVDLGSGSGILSLLALKHGAGRVFAIEREAGLQRLLAALALENGWEDRLTVIPRDSRKAKPDAKADLVVSETLGAWIFDEDVLPLMADARRRFLKPGGRLMPSRIRVMGAPAWPPAPPRRYGVRLGPLEAFALHQPRNFPAVRRRGEARALGDVVPGRDLEPGTCRGRWRSGGGAPGLAVWFEARLSKSVVLDSLRKTHWGVIWLPARAPLHGAVSVEVTFRKDGLTWRFGGAPAQSSRLAEL